MADELASVVLEDAKDKMSKAVVHTRADFANVRTGRAAPALGCILRPASAGARR